MSATKFNKRIIDINRILNEYDSYFWTIPLLVGIIVITSLPLTYISAVFVGNSYPISLVSDVGAVLPARGYFSQSADAVAILLVITAYLRCKQVEFHLFQQFKLNHQNDNDDDDNNNECTITNGKTTTQTVIVMNKQLINELNDRNYRYFICMIITAFGFMLIGNFPSNDHLIEHAIGVICVLFSLIYLFDQVCVHNHHDR